MEPPNEDAGGWQFRGGKGEKGGKNPLVKNLSKAWVINLSD